MAIVSTAAAMLDHGEPQVGRKMLEDLMRTVRETGCGARPECRPMIREVAELLRRAQQAEATLVPAAPKS